MQRTAISSIFATSGCALAIGLVAAVPAGMIMAQGAPQSITEKCVDVVQLLTGYRASQLIGSDVLSGERTDWHCQRYHRQPGCAMLSVGGFLGMGNRLVAAPFKELHVTDKRLSMEGASKDSLRALPEFRYAKE
ncbi:PRC-barrel domain containing protein [Bordetella genomosp. 11]|uniref:PRC-barrel domain containing protein n=1 Tax=Bordetella genomosp. 11 TaxID=1416808 RepID=UPI002682619A